MKLHKSNQKKRGAALVEYGLLIAGVALICAAAVAMFGHKTNDLLGTVAAVLPSSDAADTGAVNSGKVIRTVNDGNGIGIDMNDIENSTTDDAFGTGADALINDTSHD